VYDRARAAGALLMTLGIRIKLFLALVALLLGIGVVCGVYLEQQMQEGLELRAEQELWRHAEVARLMAEMQAEMQAETLAEASADQGSPARFQAMARRLVEAAGVHVGIIAPGGRILFDSRHALESFDYQEGYRAQPEIAAAFAGGRGMARRYSPAFEAEMLHVALPFEHPDGRGVVRVSMPTAAMAAGLAELRGPLLAAGLIGVAGMVLVSWLASHVLSRTLRELLASTHAVAGGNGGRRIDVAGSDEIGALAGSINRMADDMAAAASALLTERARFQAVLEGMSEAVITLDRERRVTLFNSAAARLLGFEGDPTGQPLIELVRTPAIHRLLSEPGSAGTRELELPGSPPRRVLAQVTPSRQGSDYVVVMHDVTDIRQLETVRRDFVANVSHELRTPVSIIRANSETLIDGAVSDPVHGPRLLEALHRNAERLSRLIDDLLDLARLEADHYQLEIDELSVQVAVRKAVDAVERAAEARDIRVEIDVDPALRVRADEKALDQILVNYLDNAVKYTPGGGTVRVSAHRRADRVRIDVTDDGPGIAPQHRQRIFERFYRVDPGRSRDMGGTGLGLSIVKHLADALDGDAGMDPAQPRGSTFWVALPGAQAA
jgi:two-component system phosphate regulon sensor histidine kinase PhoR